MEVNKKWQCYEKYVIDGKPTGFDGKEAKTTIVQEWRPEKYRMDYFAQSNMDSTGYHLKGFNDLESFVRLCLTKGHVIEIIPDYDRPDDRKY